MIVVSWMYISCLIREVASSDAVRSRAIACTCSSGPRLRFPASLSRLRPAESISVSSHSSSARCTYVWRWDSTASPDPRAIRGHAKSAGLFARAEVLGAYYVSTHLGSQCGAEVSLLGAHGACDGRKTLAHIDHQTDARASQVLRRQRRQVDMRTHALRGERDKQLRAEFLASAPRVAARAAAPR